MRITRLSDRGPSLVLLHGWLFNSEVWKLVLPHLVERFSVTILELGHAHQSSLGFVEHVDRKAGLPQGADCSWKTVDIPFSLYRPERFTSIISPLLKPQSVLVGHSFGAALFAKTMLCSAFSGKIGGLIFISMPLRFTYSTTWEFGVRRQVIEDFWGKIQMKEQSHQKRKFLGLLLREEKKNRRRIYDLARRSVGPFWELDEAKAGWLFLQGYDCRRHFTTMRQPFLFIGGKSDPLSDYRSMMKSAEMCLRGTYILLPHAGHLLPLSHPRLLAQQIGDFSEEVKPTIMA